LSLCLISKEMKNTEPNEEGEEEVVYPKFKYGERIDEDRTKKQNPTIPRLQEAIEAARDDGRAVGSSKFKDWAKENNCVLNEKHFRGVLERLAGKADYKEGTEHGVFFDASTQRVVKVTIESKDLMPFGHFYNVALYLEDKHNMNVLFGDDVRFEGIVDRGGDPGIVISQPVVIGRRATLEEIADDLTVRDFSFELGSTSSNHKELEGLALEDIAEKNVYVDHEGRLNYIDVHVKVPEGSMIEDFVEY
jgi:hypothetical protein